MTVLSPLIGALPALACVVCIELPDETLTDRLWAAETVALARPAADNAFVYEPVAVLHGHVDGELPFLVDAVTRRRMAEEPERVTLLLQMPDGTWQLGGQGGAELTPFARMVLAREATWTDEPDDPDRTQAFRRLHADPSPLLRRLALSELARVPYDALRATEIALPLEWLLARTADPAWTGWRPLLVQMVGLHPDPRAHALVRTRAFDVWPDDRSPWLVALIEIDGEAAIARIVEHTPADLRAREAAIRALVIQSGARPDLAPRIAEALHALVGEDAALMAQAVTGPGLLQDRAMIRRVATLLASDREVDPADRFALRGYLSRSRWGTSLPPERGPAREERQWSERSTR